jgi:predicted O-methyltransferase YrrM
MERYPGRRLDIVHPAVEKYMRELASPDDEPVLLEMEAVAEVNGFPIIGRLCGRTLEILARALGAKRIFEMGSGFGYSAYWFARATGPDGEIHLTDTDPENEKKAFDYLGRAGLLDPIRYHVGDAFEGLEATEGEFDIVYCDINKGDYPEAWRRGRERVRVGGFYISDNMLWFGRVTGETDLPDVQPGWTEAIMETNRLIANDPDFRDTIIPTRDGMVVALRTR